MRTIFYSAVLYCNVAVSVGPALLMPPPQGMKDLVDHNPRGLAPISNGYLLRTPYATHIGVTPTENDTHILLYPGSCLLRAVETAMEKWEALKATWGNPPSEAM